MKVRSILFLTLSLIVHAACITALALSHFRSLESPAGNDVEVTMGETGAGGDALAETTSEVKTDVQPTIKPIETPKEQPAPLPPKVVQAKPKVKKVAKATPTVVPVPVAELPSKELPAKVEPTPDEPENMDPQIEEAQAVAVAPAVETPKEEPPKFVPVKESAPAQADTSAEPVDKVGEAAPVAATAAATGTGAAALGQGGDTKGEAVDYLALKQFSGNRSPEYPLTARKEQRQGEVALLYRVTKEGRVADVQIAKSSGHADLDEAAVKAIGRFKFVPGQEGWAKHPVIFKLNGIAAALPSKLRTKSASADD
jgi:protein TonB